MGFAGGSGGPSRALSSVSLSDVTIIVLLGKVKNGVIIKWLSSGSTKLWPHCRGEGWLLELVTPCAIEGNESKGNDRMLTLA
jgi:hypothetical protein